MNSPYCGELWQEIKALGERYRSELTTESLKDMTSIAATRRVYKACGKDPSRYRPASEALIRRMLQGKELYQRDTLVDLVNLASIAYGDSIGGFDADKFVGNTLTLGIGREGEPYEGIGRGLLNICGLPVYRDAEGGVGTPRRYRTWAPEHLWLACLSRRRGWRRHPDQRQRAHEDDDRHSSPGGTHQRIRRQRATCARECRIHPTTIVQILPKRRRLVLHLQMTLSYR